MIPVAPLRRPETVGPIVWPRSRSSILNDPARSFPPAEAYGSCRSHGKPADGFPTAPWTGYARPQEPQAQQQLSLRQGNRLRCRHRPTPRWKEATEQASLRSDERSTSSESSFTIPGTSVQDQRNRQSFLRALSQALVPEPRFELGPSYEEGILSRNERGDESTFI